MKIDGSFFASKPGSILPSAEVPWVVDGSTGTFMVLPLVFGVSVTSCDRAGPVLGVGVDVRRLVQVVENIPAAIHRRLAPGSVLIQGTEGLHTSNSPPC